MLEKHLSLLKSGIYCHWYCYMTWSVWKSSCSHITNGSLVTIFDHFRCFCSLNKILWSNSCNCLCKVLSPSNLDVNYELGANVFIVIYTVLPWTDFVLEIPSLTTTFWYYRDGGKFAILSSVIVQNCYSRLKLEIAQLNDGLTGLIFSCITHVF